MKYQKRYYGLGGRVKIRRRKHAYSPRRRARTCEYIVRRRRPLYAILYILLLCSRRRRSLIRDWSPAAAFGGPVSIETLLLIGLRSRERRRGGRVGDPTRPSGDPSRVVGRSGRARARRPATKTHT